MEIIDSKQCPECLSKDVEYLELLEYCSCNECGHSWLLKIVYYVVR